QSSPSFGNSYIQQIVPGSWKGHAQVHPSIRRHGEGVRAAIAGEELSGGRSWATALFFCPPCCARPLGAKHHVVDADHVLRGESVLQGFERAVDARVNIGTVDELDPPALDQCFRLLDLMLVQ